jgi:arylsulfatase A-like enzyme
MSKNIKGQNTSFNWKSNIYIALIKWFFLIMVVYTACRVGFYLFNASYFPNVTFSSFLYTLYGGLRFDISAVLYSNSLFLLLIIIPNPWQFKPWYKKLLKYVFVIVNSVAIGMNMIDFVYFRFTLRRTTSSIFKQFENEQNMGKLFFEFFIDYWYMVLLFIILVVLIAKLFSKVNYNGPQIKVAWQHYIGRILLLPVFAALFVGGVRGGFRYSTRPITLSNAAEYANDPKEVNIVLNTPFAFIRTIRTAVIQKVNYFTDDKELISQFTPLHKPNDSAAFVFDNVVIIILESYSKEFISIYNKDVKDYIGYSPFLDSLIAESQAYQYSFANGRKSIDALPSVISSIPSIEVPYVLSHYSGNKINSLPALLKKEGYYSAFFHGAPNGSMGFDAFAKNVGFEDYFGKTEYNNDADFDNTWGIWDEKFLQFFAHKMNTFKQPFLSTVFTVSSHEPYKLPTEYQSIFKGGPLEIYKTIQYTDYSLRKFFETASKMPWYKNTLFVFTADHASAETKYEKYNSLSGFFSIPIFFYKPGQNWASMNMNSAIQQIDIMPTILSYLHYNKPYIAFGRNVFDSTSQPFAFNYLNNMYQLFMGDYLLTFDGKATSGLYNFKTDFTNKNNLAASLPDTTKKLETKIKAFIQQYNNRMVDDDLTPEGSQIKLIQEQH